MNADNTVERRTVVVTGTQDGVTIIGKGLADGEKVVVDGQYRLTNGARIRVDTPNPGRPPPATPSEPLTAHGKD